MNRERAWHRGIGKDLKAKSFSAMLSLKSTDIDEKPLPLSLRVVPDTSIIIDGFLSRKIEKNELAPVEVIIHEAVLAELESQANKNKETGFLGLEEVKKLRAISQQSGFKVSFKGSRPTDFEIKHARTGEIDSLIRKLACEENATLVTADKVQSLVAESKGIEVILYEFAEEETQFILDKFFDDRTMSVHIREKCQVKAKKGIPGDWEYASITDELLDRDAVRDIAKEIVEEAGSRMDGFVESDRKGSTIVQIGNNRIIISRPPFSDGYEITCVRPIRKLSLSDYNLSEKAMRRIDKGAEGILLAGSPGHGKSTFAQALAEHYLSKKRIVKTIESPRDMNLSDEVTQYSLSQGSSAEIHDILLLSRPDYTIFDEMRSTEDFRLFSDLRLSGVGMVGVVHATNPIDGVQRFIGRIELGVIPHIIDTVIFIRNGMVEKIFLVSLDVKVPGGMTESDLARPIVTVSDFETGRLEFEIYTFGEATVVVPVKSFRRSPVQKLAELALKEAVNGLVSAADVEMLSDYECRIVVPMGEKSALIGDHGAIVEALQEKFGIHMDVFEEKDKEAADRIEHTEPLGFNAKVDKKNVMLDVGGNNSDLDVDIYVDNEFLLSAKSSKRGIINISLGNAFGKMLYGCLSTGRAVEIRGKRQE
jgi:ATPase